MFDQIISIYKHARDATGQYTEDMVDMETGELISVPVRTMTIRQFCLSDLFRDKVQQIRALAPIVNKYKGVDMASIAANEGDEYAQRVKHKIELYGELKRSLPAATLSGMFSYRRQADLVAHSGYIVLDMDYQDNKDNPDWLDWDAMKKEYFSYYPEIALCMRSCSGTGYFALVPLAFPERHKEQARAIMELYKMRHITLDASCKDPTRLRFASWDDAPYINVNAVPYRGLDSNEHLTRSITTEIPANGGTFGDGRDNFMRAERLVKMIEQRGQDITGSYDQCFRIGVSLKNFGAQGLGLWKRICRFRDPSSHAHFVTDAELERTWQRMGEPGSITLSTFFGICRDNGVLMK